MPRRSQEDDVEIPVRTRGRGVRNDEVTLESLARVAKLKPGDWAEVTFDHLGLWSIKVTKATPALRRMMRSRPILRKVHPRFRGIAMTEPIERVKQVVQGPEWIYEEDWDPKRTDCRHCRQEIFWSDLMTQPGEWVGLDRDRESLDICTNSGGHEPL